MRDESREGSRPRRSIVPKAFTLKYGFSISDTFIIQACISMAQDYCYLVRFKHIKLNLLLFIISATCCLHLCRKTVEEGECKDTEHLSNTNTCFSF